MDVTDDISIAVSQSDISELGLSAALDQRSVAWDIETSGLDWHSDVIGTCQLYVEGYGVEIVQINGARPPRLIQLLESFETRKIFHHALFDLRFMCSHWQLDPHNIACTKVIAKLVEPKREAQQYSLKPLLAEYLGAEIEKTQQTSDWLASSLSGSQLLYAAQDVIYLPRLLDALEKQVAHHGLMKLVRACFDHIPVRVELELREMGDVFAY